MSPSEKLGVICTASAASWAVVVLLVKTVFAVLYG